MKAFTFVEGAVVASLVGTLGVLGFMKIQSVEEGASATLSDISSQRLEHSAELESMLSEEVTEITCSVK